MNEKNWQVFQSDVLDVLNQYRGYFDFFEGVGSMKDNSRPDCVARISRDNKKEIWVIDAKNKASITDQDEERMGHYIKRIENNPSEIGLDESEIPEYSIRGIFVTSSGRPATSFEHLEFPGLHQFLQKELVYTDTDRVVRDVAKMIERRQLSQGQARLLFNAIKPFEKSMEAALDELERLETKYIDLHLEKPPLNCFDADIPVDAALIHQTRDHVYLFDIPYSQQKLGEFNQKMERISEKLSDMNGKVFYAVLNRFEPKHQDFFYQLDEIEDEIRSTTGIVSPEDIAELFTPNIPVEKEYGDESLMITDNIGSGFKLEVRTNDDINHNVKVLLPEEAVAELRDTALNSRKEIGKLEDNYLIHNISVKPGIKIERQGKTEPWNSYCDTVKAVYGSSVNPVFANKVNGS